MFRHLKNNFMQAFTGVFVWIILLITIFIKPQTVTLIFIWKMLAISAVASLVFGVLYTYLWSYSTNKAGINIIISSIFNFAAGQIGIYLFSRDMFLWLMNYTPIILIVTFFGHVIGFYFYSKYENKKSADRLNILLDQKRV
ncbi:hypothetical protein [Peptostreptococcus faecalis]|uniref:hypothetical protein n=1 Tax=Peptostreptococcus faecalis TaxID=2045015 RepID=UPI000C7E03A2|nr:hypothetical protein [Peptostreptococcus faecalis]